MSVLERFRSGLYIMVNNSKNVGALLKEGLVVSSLYSAEDQYIAITDNYMFSSTNSRAIADDILINAEWIKSYREDDSELDLGTQPDAISPTHYTAMTISPLEYITKNDIGWNIGNVIKYVSRYKNKNGIEDLKKAMWYLEDQIKREEENLC